MTRRLLPFLLLMYVLAFLDRANVGFAKKAFQLDTGISDAAFAFGASIFFLGYALLEIPSNLIMHRVGARVWMCRIMVTWGLISAAMVFAHDETTFYVLRVLLGAAEAGFFPGVILYLTYWYPSHARARATGLFYFGAPLAFIFGSPLSGLLLDLHGTSGLQGWQWLFLVEGLLASLVGIWAYWYLDNRPGDAKWLSKAEKRELNDALAAEEQIAVIPYNPLAGGLLTGKHRPGAPTEGTRFTLGRAQDTYRERYWHEQMFATVDDLRAVAEDAGVPLTTLAVQWVLANPVITSPIVGASRPDQLAASVAAAETPLASDTKQRLDELTAIYRQGDHDR